MKTEKHLMQYSAEWIEVEDPFEHITKVARICYKSDVQLDEGADFRLIKQLIDDEHHAMLEHAHFSFLINAVPGSDYSLSVSDLLINIPGVAIDKCEAGWIVTVSASHLFNPTWNNALLDGFRDAICNEYELWNHDIGCDRPEAGQHLTYPMVIRYSASQPLEFEITRISPSVVKMYPFYPNHIFYSCKFICDRGVSHELVRHRASFAQESTRYCNYTSDRFNRSVSFMLPSTWSDWPEECKSQFLEHATASEYIYNYMIYKGMDPEQARAVLPNSLKTEIVMTANVRQWRHFFDLRYFGTTGEPHPDMKHVATLAYDSMPDDI